MLSNAPCKAKTPIVTDLSMVIKVVIMMVCVLKGKKKFWKEEEFELKRSIRLLVNYGGF